MRKKAKKVLLLIVGIFFILLGIVGTFLPVLQGILFMAIGILLISFCSPTFRLWIEKHTAKYPKLQEQIKKIENFITKIVGEI